MNLKETIKQCKKYDAKAQEVLYKHYSSLLFGICLKYCGNKALAEDLFQESFITIFKKIEQFKHKGSFEGWIKRITVNTILAHFRKQKYLVSIDNHNLIENIEEDDDFNPTNYSLEFLLATIQNLPNQYRLVFNMYVLDGYSHKEIAELLNISEGTSKSNLSRAKTILKKELKKVYRKEEINNE